MLLATAAAAALVVPAISARAADVLKADNVDDLDLGTSWVGGTAPGTEDVGVWDATVTAANSTALSAPYSLGGIRIANPGGLVTIGAVGGTNGLTLGRFGIDMSAATQDLTINAPVTIQGLGGIYDWNVAAGRTLTLTALPVKNGRTSNNTGIVRFSTTGAIFVGLSSNLLIDNQNNPYALFGNNDWAAANASGQVVAATYTPAITAITAGTNADIQGDFTQAATVDFASMRFNDPTPRTVTISNSNTARTWTARGILVTENSGGATITGQANSAFIRPSRSSVTNTAFPIINNSVNDLTIAANIANGSSGAATHVVKHGPGRLILAHGGNGYTGGTTITGGAVVVSSNTNLGPAANAAAVTLAGGTLATTATMALDNGTNFRPIVVDPAGGALDVASATTLTVGGAISGAGTLNKNGAGLLVIGGNANTHTGTLAINSGNVQMIAGSNLAGSVNIATGTSLSGGGSIAGMATVSGLLNGNFATGPVVINSGGRTSGNLTTGAITVNAGATFAGNVTSSGTAVVNSGALVTPGSSIGTMTLAGLDLAAGTQTLNYEFGTAGLHDQVNVTGADAFTLSGAAGSKTINIASDGSGTITNGVYTLIDYTGSALADVSQLTLGTLPLRVSAVGGLIHNTGDTSIQVNLTSDAPKWVGNVSSAWDINTTQNWKEITSGAVTTYQQPTAPGDNVLFDNTAVNGTVNVTTTVAPASITIDNTSVAYNFTGVGKITGTTGLTKNGSGTATIANTGGNDYTGPTAVNAGTLVLGADNVIGDGSAVSVSGGATLNIGAQNDATGALTLVDGTIAGTTGTLSAASYEFRKGTVGAILGGAGGLTKTTADTVTIAAPATYTGTTAIQSGTLRLGAANALPAASAVTLGAGGDSGTLDLDGNSVQIGGLASAGSGGAANTVTSAVPATLTVGGTGNTSFSGTITGSVALHKTDVGNEILTGSNSYTGGTTISGGTLNINADAALGSGSGGIAFAAPGGTLQLAATIGTYNTSRAVSLGAGATGTIDTNGATNTAELSGLISGDGILAKAGAGTLRLMTANTYTGGTNQTNGALFVGNNAALGTGTITFTGGNVQLDNGITLSNNLHVSAASGDNMIDVPLGGDATFAGSVTNQAGGQFRPGATGGGTLYLTGNTPAFNSFFIIPRGNITLAGAGSFITTGSAVVGRANQFISSVAFTVQDNAVFSAASVGIGGGATGGGTTDLGDYNVTVTGNGSLTSTGNFDLLNAVATTSGTSKLNLNGGVTTVGGFIQTTTAQSSTINFNGGVLRAAASNVAWLPALTSLTAQVHNGGAVLDSNGFDVTVSQPLVAASGSTGGLTKNGAGTVTLAAANTYTGGTSVTGGTLAIGQSLTTSSTVTTNNDGVLFVPSNGTFNKFVKTGAISITGDSKIDLSDNKLITTTPVGTFDGAAYNGVQGEIQRAYNFGAWDMPGLTTSQPNAGQNAGPLSGTTTIGVAKAEQILFIGPDDTATFAGQTVTGVTTIAMYTYAGDVNFDGLVDGADYGTLDNWIQFPGTDGYANGDVNYDGVIDGADYGVLDNSIQLQGDPIPGAFSAFEGGASASAGLSGATAVPEPTACGFAIFGTAALLGRRRRRAAQQ